MSGTWTQSEEDAQMMSNIRMTTRTWPESSLQSCLLQAVSVVHTQWDWVRAPELTRLYLKKNLHSMKSMLHNLGIGERK